MRVSREIDGSQFHSHCGAVKNITLTLEDELYERSRVIAAQKQTTVTGLVREYLTGLASQEVRREQARKDILGMVGKFRGEVGRLPSREERNARR